MSTEQSNFAPHLNLSPEEIQLQEQPDQGGGVDLGFEVETNESDSLDNLEVLPGVRIVEINARGPAAAAGLKTGDVILSIDGLETNDVDAVAAITARIRESRVLKLEARRDTTVFQASLNVQPSASGNIPPRELYRVDPVATKAGYTSEVVHLNTSGIPTMTARIVKMLPECPLARTGLRVGDRIISINGAPVSSAQGLVSSLNEDHQLGETVRFGVLRGENSPQEYRVRLWTPGRRLSRLAFLPLFNYESKLRPATTEFSFIDFWLFSIFHYKRLEGEREFRILTFIRFSTGYGELVEEEGLGESGETGE